MGIQGYCRASSQNTNPEDSKCNCAINSDGAGLRSCRINCKGCHFTDIKSAGGIICKSRS